MKRDPTVAPKPAAKSSVPSLPSINQRAGAVARPGAAAAASGNARPAATGGNSASSGTTRAGSNRRPAGKPSAATPAQPSAPQQQLPPEQMFETVNEKVTAQDVQNDIDDFEMRLAHGAVYSGGPHRRPAPRAGGNNGRQQQGQAPRGKGAAAAVAATGAQQQPQQPLQRPLTVDNEGEVDEKVERKDDQAMVKKLPDYGDGDSDSD